MNSIENSATPVERLVAEFYPATGELCQFHSIAQVEMPQPFRQLLAHEEHMTVTVETFHGCPVDVCVLQARRHDEVYCREITLERTSDRQCVQYGIVRMNLNLLDPEIRDEILQQNTPLGRILIERDVMRQVKLLDLFRIECGPALARVFGVATGSICYGREALILCESAPAIDLLEIIPPLAAR